MTIRPFTHQAPGQIVFGKGALNELAAQQPLKKAHRLLVISDQGVRKAGVLDRALTALGAKVALVEDGVVPDADVAHIEAMAIRAKEHGVDAIVAVGGGSVMDTGKGVGAILATGKRLGEMEGFANVRAKLPPLVCVPTTAGTGSESTQFMVVKDAALGRKRLFTDLSLVPAMGVLDPETVRTLPRHVTAATGVDALTHAVEALASKMRNPFATNAALAACRTILVDGALQKSLDDGEDLDARGAMLIAATMAGQAISSAMLGAVHGFAHSLGAVKGVPHGIGNGVFLVPIMKLNAEKARGPYEELARALGGSGVTFAIDAIEKLVHGVCGVPTSLAALGVVEADLDLIADQTLADPDLLTNPVTLTDKEKVVGILRGRM